MRALLLLLLLSACHAADGSDALWRIVHLSCVPHARAGAPYPCISVDPATGTALLKDRRGASQILLIPTAKVTGIEDPAVLGPAAEAWFPAAWAATPRVSALAGRDLPRQDLSLAINAQMARTQNQLHIHVDCVAPSVAAALRLHGGAVGPDWTLFPAPFAGARYMAIRVPGLASPDDPFRLVADGLLPRTGGIMARTTIVVVGAELDGRPDFIVLAGQADPIAGVFGDGEALQDHSCALAHHQ